MLGLLTSGGAGGSIMIWTSDIITRGQCLLHRDYFELGVGQCAVVVLVGKSKHLLNVIVGHTHWEALHNLDKLSLERETRREYEC